MQKDKKIEVKVNNYNSTSKSKRKKQLMNCAHEKKQF